MSDPGVPEGTTAGRKYAASKAEAGQKGKWVVMMGVTGIIVLRWSGCSRNRTTIGRAFPKYAKCSQTDRLARKLPPRTRTRDRTYAYRHPDLSAP